MIDKKQIFLTEFEKAFNLPGHIKWKAIYAKLHKVCEIGTFTKEELLKAIHNVMRTKVKTRYDIIAAVCPTFIIDKEKKKFDKVDTYESFLNTSIAKMILAKQF